MTIERGIPHSSEYRMIHEPNHRELLEYRHLADATRKRMNLNSGSVNVFDVPGEGDGRPVFLAQGFGVIKPRYRNMHAITSSGRRLIASYPASRYGGKVEPHHDHFPEDIRRARQIIEIFEKKNIRHADIIGKSGGAAGSLIAGILRPDLIDNIVLLNPNGSIRTRPRDLSRRFVSKAVNTKKDPDFRPHAEVDVTLRDAGFELVTTLFANPKRTIDEIAALGNTDLYDLMSRTHDGRTLISVVIAAEDELFPMGEIFDTMRAIQKEGIDHDPFVGFYVVKGGHDNLAGDSGRMRLCINALDNMQALREKKIFWRHMGS